MICNVFAPARADVLLVLFRVAAALAAGWLRAASALFRPARAPAGPVFPLGLEGLPSVATPRGGLAFGDDAPGLRTLFATPGVGAGR